MDEYTKDYVSFQMVGGGKNRRIMKKIAQVWTLLLSISILGGVAVTTFSEVMEYRLIGSLLLGGYFYCLGIAVKKSFKT